MTTHIQKRRVPLLPLLLLVFLSCSVRVASEEEEVEEEEPNKAFLYNSEDALPVIEYLANDEREQQDGPDFIYGPNNGPRLVVSTRSSQRLRQPFFRCISCFRSHDGLVFVLTMVILLSSFSSALKTNTRNSTLPGVHM